MIMKEFLNELSGELKYIKHRMEKGVCHIYCESKNKDRKPVHARQERIIKDLPFGDKETYLHIISKRYYKKDGTTYAEEFDFINDTGRRTRRLDEKIVKVSKESNMVGTEAILGQMNIKVSDTTIIRMLKKNRNNR